MILEILGYFFNGGDMKVDLLNLSNWRRYYILSGCFSGGDMKVDYKMTKNGGDMKLEWRKFKVEEI